MAWHAHAPAAHDLRVRHVRLRGPQAEVARLRDDLAVAWARAAWPLVGDDEVLWLRHLRLRGTAQALAADSAAAARALAARAVDPWSPAADRAEALRFASRADFVAWQLHRLMQAPARPAAPRVAALLGEAAAALPVVWRRLRQAGGDAALADLWRALDAAAAQQVLAAVAVATGWSPALRSPDAGPAHDAQDERAIGIDPSALAALQQAVGRPGQPAQDPRTRLAALLAWWLHAPARLQGGDAPRWLHAAAQWLAAAPIPHSATGEPAVAPGLGAMPTTTTTPVAPVTPAGLVPVPHHPPLPSGPPTAPSVGQALRATGPGNGQVDVATPSPPDGLAAAPGPLHAAQAPAAGDLGLFTTQGGVFWLFNVLALPVFQSRLRGLREPQAGWREWVRLALALGAEPDDAWCRWVAGRALLDDTDRAALHGLRWADADARPLLDPARARFGEPALRAAMAPRLAYVVADEARVDVHLRLADADLDVRRAGLDVDPGWLPWLGCTLRWHFGSALAPA